MHLYSAAAACRKAITAICVFSRLLAEISLYIFITAPINLSSYTVIKTVIVGSGPEGIAAAPNGKTVYVTNHLSNGLFVINTDTFSVITINTGQDPIGVSVNPNNKFVYVSNFNSNTVSVISTASNSVVDTITGFKSPSGIADAPSGSI